MLVAQNSLGPVCPVPLTVRGTFEALEASLEACLKSAAALGGAAPTGAVTRTVNGTGHTGPSEFCATSI